MSHTRTPLAAFTDELFETVADELDLTTSDLREVARRHQEGVRELPGVDDIVYEWRNQFHQDPLVYQDETVYVLALRDYVWEEFGDDLGIDGTTRDALQRLHARQARAIVEDARLEPGSALVLTRP